MRFAYIEAGFSHFVVRDNLVLVSHCWFLPAMIRLTQKKLFRPTQDLRLTDDDFVTITIKRILSERTFKLDLRDFEPEPSQQKAYSQKPVALGIIFGLLMLTGAVPALTERDPTQRGPFIVTAVIWGGLLLATALYARFTRSDLLAYFHRYSGKVILTLNRGNPNQASYDDFVTALTNRLKILHPRTMQAEEAQPPQFTPPFSLN